MNTDEMRSTFRLLHTRTNKGLSFLTNNMHIILILFLCAFKSVCSDVMVTTPQSLIRVREDESTTLTCRYDFPEQHNIFIINWYLDDDLIWTHNSADKDESGAKKTELNLKEVEGLDPETNHALIIENVKVEHNGTYQCSVEYYDFEGAGSSGSVRVDVDVLVPPNPVIQFKNVDDWEEEKEATITCLTNRVKPLHQDFYLNLWNDSSIVTDSNPTALRNSDTDSDGVFQVEVDHNVILHWWDRERTELLCGATWQGEVFKSEKKRIDSLKFGPKRHPTSPTEAFAGVGHDAMLMFKFYMDPAPDAPNCNTGGDDRYRVSSWQNSASDSTEYFFYLYIDNVENYDYKRHDCDVSNGIGNSVRFSVELKDLSKPMSPNAVSVTDITMNSATVTWKSNLNGGSEQTFSILLKTAASSTYTAQEDINDVGFGENVSSELKDLSPSTEYTVFVRATNEKGIADSPSYTFTTEDGANDVVGAAVGGVIGGILVVTLVVVVFVCVRRKKKNQEKPITFTDDEKGPTYESNENLHDLNMNPTDTNSEKRLRPQVPFKDKNHQQAPPEDNIYENEEDISNGRKPPLPVNPETVYAEVDIRKDKKDKTPRIKSPQPRTEYSVVDFSRKPQTDMDNDSD